MSANHGGSKLQTEVMLDNIPCAADDQVSKGDGQETFDSDGLAGASKGPIRRALNRVLAKIARMVPGATTVRPWLHRLRGVEINGQVFIGDEVYLENEYPECIRLEHGAQIGLRSTVIAHTRTPGQIIIGRNAFIGPCSVIVSPAETPLTIGEGAVISAGSIITTNIPARTLVRPERVKAYATVTVPFTRETSYRDFRKGLRPIVNSSKSSCEDPAPAVLAALREESEE